MSKVLVVDDSRAIRTILSKILMRWGFEVCQACDGAEGLAVLEREHPNISLICVDWNMPNIDGFEFLKRVRSNDKFSNLLIVMVTTETHFEQMSRALAAGANEYIMKPFTDEIVGDKLRLLGVLQ
jgi:two-component system chemotaxis response regulator CheY